jgi:hypothetical protein
MQHSSSSSSHSLLLGVISQPEACILACCGTGKAYCGP